MSQAGTSLDSESRVDLGDGLGGAVGDGLDVGLGRIQLLVLTGLSGEEDEACLVGLQSGNVGGEGLLRVVRSSVVNRNTDGGSELSWDTSFLYQS